jgi:RNA polymerase sigma factor (sigma-70 family)
MTAPIDARADAREGAPAGGAASDEELVARVARRDERAFADLYARWSPTVMRFAHHLAYDRDLAEDVVQEAFLRVWRFAGGFRAGGRFAPWVLQIARRLVYDRSPAWRRGRAAGGGAPALEPTGRPDAAEGRARQAETESAVRDALLSLSAPLRETFVLVRLCGTTHAAAAAALECPVGTVKSRMAAAEAALRARLGRLL